MATAAERRAYYAHQRETVLAAVPARRWAGTAAVAAATPWGLRTVRRVLLRHAEGAGVARRYDATGYLLWRQGPQCCEP